MSRLTERIQVSSKINSILVERQVQARDDAPWFTIDRYNTDVIDKLPKSPRSWMLKVPTMFCQPSAEVTIEIAPVPLQSLNVWERLEAIEFSKTLKMNKEFEGNSVIDECVAAVDKVSERGEILMRVED